MLLFQLLSSMFGISQTKELVLPYYFKHLGNVFLMYYRIRYSSHLSLILSSGIRAVGNSLLMFDSGEFLIFSNFHSLLFLG